MEPNTVVAERFVVEHLAGTGGMGDVYRAVDRLTGEPVALKVMRDEGTGEQAARFTREAEVLAGLRHPGIVRYVAHGRTGRSLFLAMEWLDGESLGERLKRHGLTLDESVTLVRRIAEALGFAHRKGIVHRDLKPSNLFLVGGSSEVPKILDFGIARLRERRRELTVTGAMLGTPGYMAPEQARGEKDVDARADVFALGCVFFKCLTGRAAFSGDDGLAVLLKVVLEDAPRVAELRDDVPPALDELVARMLSKAPDGRPADAAALLGELDAVGTAVGPRPASGSTHPPSLTATERRVLCLVVARVARPQPLAEPTATPAPVPTTLATERGLGPRGPRLDGAGAEAAAADAERAPVEGDEGEPTLALDPPDMTLDLEAPSSTFEELVPVLADWAQREQALRATAERHGGKVHWLADGSVLVTVDSSGTATDQAARAARCALEMRVLLPDVPVALVAGRAVVSRRVPVGEVIDRAVGLLGPSGGGDAVRLDEVALGLLDARFDVAGDGDKLVLRGVRDIAEATRTIFGRPSPCVGREREIASLKALWDECRSEPRASAVVVTAAAGVGKSRLRFELHKLLRDEGRPLSVLFSRGDSLSAGSPFGMLARAVQRAAGLLDGELLSVRRQKLRARVARHVPSADRARVTDFLGELCGVRFDDAESVQLRAARRDAMLMGDQLRRAWEDFLAAECGAQPVLLILEDLQWGDLPSVRGVDAALRNLADRPLLVLALGRPELDEVFPKLWAGRAVTRMSLGDLSKRGAERLVREILGAEVDDATVTRVVERAAGNAFYLEELMRAVVSGRGDALPETVLAMAQARLEGLPPDARRVLRAASVFGQIFWLGGVTALLGGEQSTIQVDEFLAELCDQEVISRRGEGKFPGEDEHIFRHALLREAAYAMLTEGDRVLGHRLAGEWLEKAGENDAVVLAEHFERGDEPSRAVHWYRLGAEQALGGNDFVAAIARVERAVAAGAEGELLGALLSLEAEAHAWRGENADAERCAGLSTRLLPRGTGGWYVAAGQVALASGRLGNLDRLSAVARELGSVAPADSVAAGPRVVASAHAAGQLLYAGRADRAEPLVRQLDELERAHAAAIAARAAQVEADPSVWGWVHSTRATQALFAGDPAGYLVRRQAAAQAFEAAGDLRNGCMQRVSVGYAYLELGAHAEAEGALRDALAAAGRMQLSNAEALAKHNLGLALARLGHLEEARDVEAQAAQAFVAQGNRRLEGGARIYLATILAMMGDLETADEEARLAVVVSTPTPPGRAQALAALAQVKLLRRQVPQALEAAREAMELLESLGGIDEGESLVRLVYAEALSHRGAYDAARSVIGEARARLLARAGKIGDDGWRKSFLERVPDNARTLALARAWVESGG